MFDLVIEDHHTDRDILLHILKELKIMALDVSKLNENLSLNSSAVSALSGKVDLLIAAHADPAGQAAVDAAAVTVASNTDVVNAASAKIDGALNPAPPVEPPAV